MDDIKEIRRKIKIAREFALDHFNADSAKNTSFFSNEVDSDGFPMMRKPSFFVEFPGPDEMTVTPSIFGKPAEIKFAYKLYFKKDGNVVWKGKNPFTGAELAPLLVEVNKDKQ